MALFFGGNPFASPVGRKIEQATDPSLPSENWALNMEICDLINETEDGPKDAMKAIRKRLNQNATRNFNVIMYTLTVLETCVKNCHKKFLVLVCNKEFIQEMVKLIGPKNDPPVAVQQKVLNLIQCWADAFKHQPDLYGVVQVYSELKQKGIEFPMTDLDAMPPIQTPQRTLPEDAGAPATLSNMSSSSSSILNQDQIGKLTSELRVVEGNMTVLSEMLSELVPGKEPPSDLELLKELYTTCQAMQQRLVELIGQISNDEITAELLRVNDGLNNLFLRYSRYEKNRKSSSKEREKEENSLIDLNDCDTTVVSSMKSDFENLKINSEPGASQKPASSIPLISSNSGNKDDEFDMFAQSRNVTYESSKTGGSTYEANKEITNLSTSLSAAAQSRPPVDNSSSTLPVPDLIGMHLEQDFDEMANWLGEKQEESLTSSEFEKFLAERAAAAEALPSSVQNNSSSSSSKTQTKQDSMLAL